MMRTDRCLRVLPAVLLLGASATACTRTQEMFASPRTHMLATSPGAPVPVTSFHAIAGVWAGVTSRANGRSDWFELTVHEDGTFEGSSKGRVGVLAGQGRLELSDGKVVATDARGSVVITLYDIGGRVLLIDFTEKKGTTYSGELHPQR